MKSPADMKVIPIDITNACMFSCSSCTRFCGHQTQSTFMDFETFKKVVDSFEGFQGIVGIIGGEPTLHPEFEKFIEYYASKIPERGAHQFFRLPVKHFSDYSKVLKYQRGRKRALFTSLGTRYYEHFELIQDVFPYQSINDHQNTCMHQSLMITRKELGIPDEEWIKLRDACWLQNVWSAGTTHKGAFFCEIAAHLDLLFDGPGGWPIEPGWWKRKPEAFGDQLNWCEYCSACLPVPRTDGSLEHDIVSPVMMEKLKAINSPKVRKGKVSVFDTTTYDPTQYKGNTDDPIWYLPEDQRDAARVSPTNHTLHPRHLDLLVDHGHAPAPFLEHAKVAPIDADAFRAGAFKDWVAIVSDGAILDPQFLHTFFECVLNPGCLYVLGPNGDPRRMAPGRIAKESNLLLFNRRARALRGLDELPRGGSLIERWETRKRVALTCYPDMGALSPVDQLTILRDQFLHRAGAVYQIMRA